MVILNFRTLSIFRDFWIEDDVGSDHYPVDTMVQFKYKPSETILHEQRIERTNWKTFQQKMSTWPEIDPCNTPQDLDNAVDLTSRQIKEAFDIACPVTEKRKAAKCKFSAEIEGKVKEKRRPRRDKNIASANNDMVEVRRIMTRINFLGNEIKKLQRCESRKELERHCEKLNEENNPKKFFLTFKKIANPIINTE